MQIACLGTWYRTEVDDCRCVSPSTFSSWAGSGRLACPETPPLELEADSHCRGNGEEEPATAQRREVASRTGGPSAGPAGDPPRKHGRRHMPLNPRPDWGPQTYLVTGVTNTVSLWHPRGGCGPGCTPQALSGPHCRGSPAKEPACLAFGGARWGRAGGHLCVCRRVIYGGGEARSHLCTEAGRYQARERLQEAGR